mgnify:FL=1
MKYKLNTTSCQIMGVLNITPDSFYDGGKYDNIEKIMLRVKEMINQGVDIIDIGAESSRPGSKNISAKEEITRLLPVVSKIRESYNIPLSIDSTKSEVVSELVKYNIQIINDISAISDSRLLNTIKNQNIYVCLMHMQNSPENMQENPIYDNVVSDILLYLQDRQEYCINNGINKDKIIIDPGFGFGKNLNHNYTLLNNLKQLTSINKNVLVGISRKSMIGKLLNKNVEKRLYGSLAAATLAIINKASIIRTHDVYETKITKNIIESINY